MNTAPLASRAPATLDTRSEWSRFALILVGAALAAFAVALAALFVVDPYDTGRPGLIGAQGVPDQYPYTADASRARDPRFDAAILGNSHVQALRPDRLGALTGLGFVTLMMPATWPLDQLRVLAWLVHAREVAPRVLVIGTDDYWCRPEPVRSPNFPDWLYSPSLVRYIAGLARYRSLEAAAARIALLATGKGRARPDGYWDYAPYYRALGLDDPAIQHTRLAAAHPYAPNPSGHFPGIERLPAALRALPGTSAVILLVPPVLPVVIPPAGSGAARDQRRCREALARVAADRPLTRLLDLERPLDFATEARDFFEETHYRDEVAERVEKEIARTLAAMGVGPSR